MVTATGFSSVFICFPPALFLLGELTLISCKIGNGNLRNLWAHASPLPAVNREILGLRVPTLLLLPCTTPHAVPLLWWAWPLSSSDNTQMQALH